jgi:hypothetical protein
MFLGNDTTDDNDDFHDFHDHHDEGWKHSWLKRQYEIGAIWLLQPLETIGMVAVHFLCS